MPLSGDPVTAPAEVFTALPDPGQANSVADLVERLRLLKVWAGDPSYETIKDRVNKAWTAAGRPAGELTRRSTVAYCFQPGRRRLDTDLVLAVVQALHPDTGYVTQWRQALRMIGGEIEAVAQVRVRDTLPQDLSTFTGRTAELDRLCRFVHDGARGGGTMVISAIEGMAGVGKTQLAVHAAHRLQREQPLQRVLFVNLRGFDPDPAQPPVDPAAVLDGFLRLLGVPAQNIPHGLDGRCRLYRERLAGTRSLVILDNAAGADQVRSLLPDTPGCPVLVTSRRGLRDLGSAVHITLDTFTRDEALEFLARSAPDVPVGEDPNAASRIAERCGYLPLALGLIAGHARDKPGWTLADHADRLDERHRDLRLDSGVELAFDLSYVRLAADQRRLLRRLALHPGQDFDVYAAAALAGSDIVTARSELRQLHRDHLLEQVTDDRYAFHDLVRSYAASRLADEDPSRERRRAASRLFDHYLYMAAAAMNRLHPAEAAHRPQVPVPTSPAPILADPVSARAWLDAERSNLAAVVALGPQVGDEPVARSAASETASAYGQTCRAVQLSIVLYRYLDGGHHADALTIHAHAYEAARRTGDRTGQAHALLGLGAANLWLGEFASAVPHFEQALELSRQVGDSIGQIRAMNSLGVAHRNLNKWSTAADYQRRAVRLAQQTGDRTGQARALSNLSISEHMLGRLESAAECLSAALSLFRSLGDRTGEANAQHNIGEVELRRGRPQTAADSLHQALLLYRELGNTRGEAATLNCLGEAAQLARRPTDALEHCTAGLACATRIGGLAQQAQAHAGLAVAHRTLGDHRKASEHYQHALALYTDLGMPEADQIRAQLAATSGTVQITRSNVRTARVTASPPRDTR